MSDAIVIGAGVDELVVAHFLARAGHRVRVVHAQPGAGEPAFAGWIPPRVVRDLELARNDLAIERPDVWLSVPLEPGRLLELASDIERTAAAIRAVSVKDAARWPEFCRRMHALAEMLAHVYAEPPPDPLAHDVAGWTQLASAALRMRKLGRAGIEDLLRVLPMSIADLLDDWFESDALKGALGAAGVLNLCQGPRSGGTAFNFLHHHVGSPPGVFRPPVSNVHEVLRKLDGVHTRATEVERVIVRQGRAAGVVLRGGEELDASIVVSGLDPSRTMLDLVDPGRLDPELVRAVRNVRSRGAAAHITLTLDRAPAFRRLVIAPSLDYLERAYDDAKYGHVSEAPYIEAQHEMVNGAHHVHLHVQYTPHELSASGWDPARREALACLAVATLEEHATGTAATVQSWKGLTPADLEAQRGWRHGQPYGADIALDQMLWMRPVPQLARYRTPIEGLYLCGPAMHPGGGLAGAAGANAASVILKDLKNRSGLSASPRVAGKGPG